MNYKKFCFITCVNDEDYYKEALYYLRYLYVPFGFSYECRAVRGAKSMAEGYQEAMESSDAGYKIYIHQDVHILNSNLLPALLDIFAGDNDIGLIGMAGATKEASDGMWAKQRFAGLSYGCIYETDKGGRPFFNLFEVDQSIPYKEARLVDGVFMATRHDIPWREDVFRGWHFYDLSQSAEFIRRGFKLAIPSQCGADGTIEPWCLHCGENSGMIDKEWERYRRIYVDEYADLLKD